MFNTDLARFLVMNAGDLLIRAESMAPADAHPILDVAEESMALSVLIFSRVNLTSNLQEAA